ncbi:hypothetical protein GWI33_006659 [Rhynchophorus ferrugineus]|uniref:CHK kinase-like domain-containing protein n=1 Tax=Rhynchophorus ferrugineus TaxID=354439 RepID=A0A834MCR9_RHYFE|nr:hypothetical protein GWI33_006659 [Rhynchophorus ferrugineus]
MAESQKIINLNDILSKYYKVDLMVYEQSFTQYWKPTLCELKVLIEKKKAEPEELFYFVKMCEQDIKVYIRIDHLSNFKTEVDFYDTAVPAMTEFQRRKSIYARTYQNLFPKCIGARVSAEQGKRLPDESGILLFEHLGRMGYMNPSPTEGLYMSACEIVLANLAEMHATPIAMRILCLPDFKSKVVPCLINTKQPKIRSRRYKKINEMLDELGDFDFEMLPYIPSVKRTIEMIKHNTLFNDSFSDETWITLCHSNFSILNVMLKYDTKTAIPIACKLLDFKTLEYSYCFNDLVFFLSTSINSTLFKYHFDFMLESYFSSFIQVLMEYDIDLVAYSRNNFHKHLNIQAPNMILKILQALPYIACNKYGEDGEPILGSKFKRRLRDIIILFLSRDWLKN